MKQNKNKIVDYNLAESKSITILKEDDYLNSKTEFRFRIGMWRHGSVSRNKQEISALKISGKS